MFLLAAGTGKEGKKMKYYVLYWLKGVGHMCHDCGYDEKKAKDFAKEVNGEITRGI